MAATLDAIDISEMPELLALVEQLRAAGAPRVLKRGDEEIAVLTPIESPAEFPWRSPTAEDYEAFRAAAGGWKDFDAEGFLREIYAAREAEAERDDEL